MTGMYSGQGDPSRSGRRGEHYGRGPKGYRRSDDRIREDVNDRLTWSSHIDASEIDVEVRDGEVTLKGSVDDRFAKRLAEDLCQQVYGVQDVQNQLKVSRREPDLRTQEMSQNRPMNRDMKSDSISSNDSSTADVIGSDNSMREKNMGDKSMDTRDIMASASMDEDSQDHLASKRGSMAKSIGKLLKGGGRSGKSAIPRSVTEKARGKSGRQTGGRLADTSGARSKHSAKVSRSTRSLS
jgi:hypothetical protein